MYRRKSLLRSLGAIALLLALLLTIQQLPIGQQLNIGMAPLLSALQAPGRWWQSISLWFDERSALQAGYQEATQQLQQHSALVQEVTTLREENRQLRALLRIHQLRGYRWQAAKVQGRSPDKMSQRLILLVANAKTDDVIVSSDGLVGLVDQAQAESAVIRTILDASIAVPVTMPNSSLAALVRGEGDRLIVDFVPADQTPPVGSVFFTSGAGGVFPPGLPVARITHIKPIAGQIFSEVEAVPAAHWQRESWLAMASAVHEKP